jgi:hypothetical protein
MPSTYEQREALSESLSRQSVLRKAARQPTVTVHAASEREREFGKALCAALIQLAAAIWRYYVDPHPPFVRGK